MTTQLKTPIEVLAASVMECLKTPDGVEAPAVILWTDPLAQWETIVVRLKAFIPQIFTLGSYDVKQQRGPAIWLRCIVDKPPSENPQGIPILYLPKVARLDLRAGEGCPPALRPLVELQYRGRIWHQKNGRDWTVEAFFSSPEGLGLNVAGDIRSQEAMLRALPNLIDVPIEVLKQKRMDADDFDGLLVSDPERSLLLWMNDPKTLRATLTTTEWKTFCDIVRGNYQIDPETTHPADAGQKLLTESGRWESLWKRFKESPRLYIGIVGLLRETPGMLLDVDEDRLPHVNLKEEEILRKSLQELIKRSPHEVVRAIAALEETHSKRRQWVWAQIGESPLCVALEALSILARRSETQLNFSNLGALVESYTSHGHLCDRSAIQSLQVELDTSDYELVSTLVRIVYGNWLDQCSREFQRLVFENEDRARDLIKGTTPERDCCVIFVDGLRYDLAALVLEQFKDRGFKATLSSRMAPWPTVTATAKPLAATLFGDTIKGPAQAQDFAPVFADGNAVNAGSIRSYLSEQGIDYIPTDEIRALRSGQFGAWVETGHLDELGHKVGAKLVRHVEEELQRLVDRVGQLMNAGWTRLKIVTDHGWVLLPGGLPKVDLPTSVAATKWSRCAIVIGESKTSVPTVKWYFNPEVRIAVPPGVASFRQDVEYSHGGLSLQECVVPEITVEREAAKAEAKFAGISWRGMRCKLSLTEPASGVRVDLRSNWRQPETTILAQPKALEGTAELSVLVPDDSHEGSAATFVLLDGTGNVLDRKVTTVGGG